MTASEKKALEADFDYLRKGAESVRRVLSDYEELKLYLIRIDGGVSRNIYAVGKKKDEYGLYMYAENEAYFGSFSFENMVPEAAEKFHSDIITALRWLPDTIIDKCEA